MTDLDPKKIRRVQPEEIRRNQRPTGFWGWVLLFLGVSAEESKREYISNEDDEPVSGSPQSHQTDGPRVIRLETKPSDDQLNQSSAANRSGT